MSSLYYIAPEDQIFKEVKEKATQLWTERYPEEKSPDYAKEKVARIKDLENVQDNMMYMVAMFDGRNQVALSEMLSQEANVAIRERMLDGGSLLSQIPF